MHFVCDAPFLTSTEHSLQTGKKETSFASFIHFRNKKKLQLRLHKGSDFPFLCVALFLCVCVWLFGLAGGEMAAGVVPFFALHPFSSKSKGGTDIPSTESEIMVQKRKSDKLNFLIFFSHSC